MSLDTGPNCTTPTETRRTNCGYQKHSNWNSQKPRRGQPWGSQRNSSTHHRTGNHNPKQRLTFSDPLGIGEIVRHYKSRYHGRRHNRESVEDVATASTTIIPNHCVLWGTPTSRNQSLSFVRSQNQSVNLHRTSIAKLLVTQQPLPHVMFKSKAIDSPYIVSLITGANQDIESIGPISGTLGAGGSYISSTSDLTQGLNYKNKASLENAVAQLDSYERRAYFNAVKVCLTFTLHDWLKQVNVSSRMTMVHLKFSCSLVAYQQTHTIESSPTFPFIVITHENQWVEAASKLVLMDGFKGQAVWRNLHTDSHFP